MEIEERFEKLKTYYDKHQVFPSYEKIASLLSLKSKSAAYYVVNKLVESGKINKDKRGVLSFKNFIEIGIPFIGSVHAGRTVGFDNSTEEDTMSLQDLLRVDLFSAKLFRVQGDSMINAGIFEDDMLLVECTNKWKENDMVVAEIDGMETVKYIKKDKKTNSYFLRPANDDMTDIYPEEYLKVKARVVSVIRRVNK
jgi:repressor LexA